MADTDCKDIIYLCSCAVNGVSPDPVRIKDLDNIYTIAQKHMLASLVGMALQKAGIQTKAFKEAISHAQKKEVILNYELQQVTDSLEQEGIWYMPLKGAVLKKLYPGFAMREMADVDILFDAVRAADVKTIMENLGFQVKVYDENNDDDYIKPPLSNFEMHKALFGERHDQKLFEYYRDVKKKLLKDDGNQYGYHFSPEDFYIFMVAHEYKHYSMGGTGLRSLHDTYVFLQNNAIDMEYVETETEKLGITSYEQLNRNLALKLFSKEAGELTTEEEKMRDYVITSGTFGTIEHKIENRGGKLRYLLQRIFGPTDKNDPGRNLFRKRYSTFFRHPILLPLLPFYRLFRALKTTPNRIRSEVNALRKYGEKR